MKQPRASTGLLMVLCLTAHIQGAQLSGREYDRLITGAEATTIRRIFAVWVLEMNANADPEFAMSRQEVETLVQQSSPSTMRYLMALGKAKFSRQTTVTLWVIDQRVNRRKKQ